VRFRLAVAQTDAVLGDLHRNVARHVEAAERARAQGASCVLFPELSLTGYTVRDLNWDLAIRPDDPPAALKPLLDVSRGIMVLAGGVEEGEGFGMHNAAFLLEGGVMRTVHRKVYPPTYGLFEEMRYFSPGRTVRAFDTRLGRFGVLVCEDLWHVGLPYLLARDGARMIAVLVASPTRVGGEEPELQARVINHEHQRTYARLLSVYVAACNRVGYEDGVNFWGGSAVMGPDGEALARAADFDEELIVADVDEAAVRRARRFSRHALDDNPDLIRSELERIARQERDA
jgi:predicted amidohydrolase